MKLKFDNGFKNRYVIGYWSGGGSSWTYISDILDSKEEFECTLLNIIDDYEINEEDYDDLCIFKLLENPDFNIKESKKEVINRKLILK